MESESSVRETTTADNIDSKFLRDKEGFETKGYVPSNNSGVTIATGVDLKSQSRQNLEQLGVSESIIQKLDPFMDTTMKGQVAAQKLKEVGLELTNQECQLLDSAMKAKYFKRLCQQLTSAGVNINQVPECVLSVALSRIYHSWSISKEFLSALGQGTYSNIPDLLRDPQSCFKSRLEAEAKYIQNCLAKQ